MASKVGGSHRIALAEVGKDARFLCCQVGCITAPVMASVTGEIDLWVITLHGSYIAIRDGHAQDGRRWSIVRQNEVSAGSAGRQGTAERFPASTFTL